MSDRPVICHAIQYSDMKRCELCGLTWDTNDPDPPDCNPKIPQAATAPANIGPRLTETTKAWLAVLTIEPVKLTAVNPMSVERLRALGWATVEVRRDHKGRETPHLVITSLGKSARIA